MSGRAIALFGWFIAFAVPSLCLLGATEASPAGMGALMQDERGLGLHVPLQLRRGGLHGKEDVEPMRMVRTRGRRGHKRGQVAAQVSSGQASAC